MNTPTAVELIMGYKPNPDELRFTRLPDAIAEGSSVNPPYTYSNWWGKSRGYKALRSVLGGNTHVFIGKERNRVGEEREDFSDFHEYVSSAKVLPSTAVKTNKVRRDINEYEKGTNEYSDKEYFI